MGVLRWRFPLFRTQGRGRPGSAGRILLAVLVVVLLVLAALAYAATLPYAPLMPPSRDDRGPQPDLRTFYRQVVHWARCGAHGASADVAAAPRAAAALRDMDCARLTVPLDYGNPAKGTVSLAVTRFASRGRADRRGSLVFGFGGPGRSGIDRLAAQSADFDRLRTRYDLVGLDLRGWGRSQPLTCAPSATAAQADAPAAFPDRAAADDTAVQLRAEARQYAQQARACARASGRLLPYVGATSASRDLDVLRQALGDRRLNYLGTSWGSKVGAVYAHQFPHNVGRMVLDGVADPTLDTLQTALALAKADQRGLRSFLTDCVRHHAAGCPFRHGAAAAELRLQQAYEALAGRPLAEPGAELDQQTFTRAVADSVFDVHRWPDLRAALAALLTRRDGVPLVRLAGMHPVGTGTGTGTGPAPAPAPRRGDEPPQDNAYAVGLAVKCRDTADRYTPEEAEAALPRLVRASPIMGPLNLHELLACTGWPGGGDDSWRELRAEGAPRILMVGTATDPTTPHRGARRMAAATGVGVVLTYRGQGHVAYQLSDCVRRRADGFLLTGLMPADGSTCD